MIFNYLSRLINNIRVSSELISRQVLSSNALGTWVIISLVFIMGYATGLVTHELVDYIKEK